MRRALGRLVLPMLTCAGLACGTEGSGDAALETSGASEDTGPADPTDSTGGATTTATTAESEGSDEGQTSDTGTEPDAPSPEDLPIPTGECPVLHDGDVTFSPAGIPSRAVRLHMSDAAERLDGPVVFYWHGTSSSPSEAVYGLSQYFVDAVVDAGGIVVAPTHDPEAGTFPWFLVLGNREDDLILADEVLACAIEQVGVDTRRIHAVGMSAGGLQTAQMSLRRSSYLASVATYSGGIIAAPPPAQDPDNPFAALAFHGGEGDIVVISFKDASENYVDILRANDQFAFICDHGGGHEIPDAQPSVGRFLSDHPYGTVPSPYEAEGLPDVFPDYCSL